MNEQRMQFAIGIVTLIAGFALAAIIIWFGEFQFVWEPKTTYYVAFKNAPGAEDRVPVRRAGIRIGEVRDVEYDERKSLVILTIVVENKYLLRIGDEPTLKRGLLGDTYLDIETRFDLQGRPDRPIIPADSVIEGRSPADPTETIEQAGSLIPTATDTLLDIQKTSQAWTEVGDRANQLLKSNEKKLDAILQDTQQSTERLASTLEAINKVLDPPTQENLRVTVKNVRDASDDLKPIVEAAKKTIQQVSDTTSKLDEVARNLQTATKPLAERSESTLKNLDESAKNLNLLLADLAEISGRIKNKDGTLQRLYSDPTLYQNLDEGAALLVKNLCELEQIMKDLRVFSDKIARHPGELGLQGIMTRDQGLKNVDPASAEGKHKLFRR